MMMQQRGPEIYVPLGAVRGSSHGIVADNARNNGSRLVELLSRCASSGKILVLDEPGTYRFSGSIDIASHYCEIYPGVTLAPTDATSSRIRISGTNCGIISSGAKIVRTRCQRYTVTALSVVGNVATATIPGHPFLVGDAIALRNTVGITTSLEGSSKTITAIDGDDVSFAHTSADSSATIPYERNDGWNRGPNALYPTAQLTRSQATDEAVISVIGASNWTLRGLELDGAKQSGVWIHDSPIGDLRGLKIHGTAADGIDITGASHNLKLDDIEIYDTGDDALAVIGWRAHHDVPRNVQIGKLHVHDLKYNGRGLALVGSEGFKCEQLVAENIYHAGLIIYTDGTTRTFGNKGAWFGSVTLHTCGQAAAEVTGWSSGAYGAFHVTGVSSEAERQDGVNIDDLTIVNSRGYAIADGDVAGGARNVEIGTAHFEGGGRPPSNVLAPDFWQIDIVRCKYTAQMGLLFGGANARGRSRIGQLHLRHFNFTQTRRWITGISCVDGTVTINAAGHGFTGQPTIWVSRVWSDASHADVSTERTMQLADEALGTYYTYLGTTNAWAANTAYTKGQTVQPTTPNGYRYICVVAGTSHASTEPTWTTTVGARNAAADGTAEWMCYGVGYTNSDAVTADPDVITFEGTPLSDSNSPRIYTPGGRPAPNTYCTIADNSGYDALWIGAIPSGAHLQVDEVVVAEQHFAFDAIVRDDGGANSTVTTSVDLSGRGAA